MLWDFRRASRAAKHRFRLRLAAFVVGLHAGLSVAGEDLAGPLKDAQAALASGDYARAFPVYLQHADEARNPLAQFTVGLFFEMGWGRSPDRRAACGWYERAADGKIPAAEHFTGDCLRQGIHREADPNAAARWYERAASHGHAMSLCSLGEMHVAGEGVPKDTRKGIALCLEAARQGLKPAQVRLARFYLDGVAGTPDYAAAFQVLQVTAETDYPEAQYLLARMYRDGLGRDADLDQARVWFEHAASRGFVPAYRPTVDLYRATPRDPATGLLPPWALAKAYLWAEAWSQRVVETGEQEDARRLVAEIRREMPDTWQPELDRKVKQHLAALSPEPPTSGGTRR